MGQFTITLSNNQLADIRWGTIRKKFLFFGLFKKNRLHSETKKGYIVTIEPASKDSKQYLLLKNQQGNWTFENEGFQTTPDDQIAVEKKESTIMKVNVNKKHTAIANPAKSLRTG